MPLDPVAQQLDFSAGTFQSGALEREPAGAAEKIVGLIGDDGLPVRRGGSSYKSNAALGTAGLAWVWSGQLGGGLRTIFQSKETDARLAILGVDDATPVVLRTDVAYVNGGKPWRVVVVAGMAVVVSTAGDVFVYGGSRKTGGAQTYSTGTVTLTEGSAIVTGGGGTAWLANVDPGMILWPTGLGPYVVKSIQSDTSLTLMLPWASPTNVGAGYVASTFASLNPGGRVVPIPASTSFATVANRLISMSGEGIEFSAVNEINTWPGRHSFAGASIIGAAALRDVLLVFTTAGVFAVSGMAYELTDAATGEPQHRRELVNADLVAWGHEGIASWSGALIVPCLDGIYAMDSLGAPTPIAERIADLYLGYVRAGYKPGVAEVFNGEYFLPILTSGNVWVDTLVCRLRPTHSGVAFGWSQLAGSGAEVSAFAERQSAPPVLLGSSVRAGSRVLSLASYFVPSASVKSDADGTAHSFVLTTVDYPTGGMVSNFVHSVRLVYALTDAGDAPTVAGEVSVDGGPYAALAGTGSASEGSVSWRVNRHAKNVRFRFTVSAAAADCKVKSVEVFVRHSGRR